jgi:hypothetical protein
MACPAVLELVGGMMGTYLAYRSQTGQGSTDSQSSETGFCNGGINDSLFAEAIQQAFGDLVSVWSSNQQIGRLAIIKKFGMRAVPCLRSVVLCNLLAEQENLVVCFHFLGHGLIKGFTNGNLLGATWGG